MPPVPVCFVLPDLGGGGAQRVMLEFAGGLDPQRFAVTLVVIGRSQMLADQVPQGMSMVQLGAERLRSGALHLVRCLRSLQPSIIVSVMGYQNLTVLALRPLLRGSPRILVREANNVSATARQFPSWLDAHRAYRFLYSRADAIVAPVGRIATEIAGIVPDAERRTHVIPNPVNEASLRRRATPPMRPPGTGLVLVGAGRLTAQKGFDRLIDIMPRLPTDARLTIYGDGADRGVLDQRIERLGLRQRVTLAPFSASLSAAIAGSDVFVLPSRWEGLPNVVLESLALGVPVVASKESGVEDIAQAAGSDALTIASVDDAFVDAIRRRTPAASVPDVPRLSLLPARYRREAAVAQFSDLLGRLAAA